MTELRDRDDRPAHAVATFPATAWKHEEPTVISRDGYITTPAGEGYCRESDLPWTHCRDEHAHYLMEAGRDKILVAYAEALDELLRLCGPLCPFDGKRASEHAHSRTWPACTHTHTSIDDERSYQCGFGPENYQHIRGDDKGGSWNHDYTPAHPPAPAIAAWLKENGR